MEICKFHSLEPRISKKLSEDLNFIRRIPGDLIRKEDKDMAASAQKHLENIVLELVKFNLKKVNSKNLILTGGVALNSKLCGLIDKLTFIDKFYVPQLPSDGNLALGAAIQAMPMKERFNVYSKKPYFSFKYTSKEISNAIKLTGNKIHKCNISDLVQFLKKDKVLGFFNGKSEFGPRALGGRSIIASPINKKMKDIVNKKLNLGKFQTFCTCY